MKKFIFIAIAFLSLFVFGCKRKSLSIDNVQSIIVTVKDKDIDNEILLSNYIDSIEVVRLETNEQSIISEINKVIFCKDTIYILDKKAKSILKFLKDGKFISKLEKIGQGPGEYISVFDFDIYNDNIYLLDYTQKKILIYDLNFNHQSRIRLKNYYTNISVMKNQILLYTNIYNTNDTYSLTIIDQEGKVIMEKFPYKDLNERMFDWTSGAGFCFAKQENIDNVFFSQTFNNMIYNISDQIIPYLSFNFETNGIPSGVDINSINIFDSEKFYKFKYNLFATNNLMVCTGLKGGTPFFIFYNLLSNENKIGKIKNDMNKIVFFPSWSSQNNLIASLSDEDYNMMMGVEPNNLEADLNDLLIIFHVK